MYELMLEIQFRGTKKSYVKSYETLDETAVDIKDIVIAAVKEAYPKGTDDSCIVDITKTISKDDKYVDGDEFTVIVDSAIENCIIAENYEPRKFSFDITVPINIMYFEEKSFVKLLNMLAGKQFFYHRRACKVTITKDEVKLLDDFYNVKITKIHSDNSKTAGIWIMYQTIQEKAVEGK